MGSFTIIRRMQTRKILTSQKHFKWKFPMPNQINKCLRPVFKVCKVGNCTVHWYNKSFFTVQRPNIDHHIKIRVQEICYIWKKCPLFQFLDRPYISCERPCKYSTHPPPPPTPKTQQYTPTPNKWEKHIQNYISITVWAR